MGPQPVVVGPLVRAPAGAVAAPSWELLKEEEWYRHCSNDIEQAAEMGKFMYDNRKVQPCLLFPHRDRSLPLFDSGMDVVRGQKWAHEIQHFSDRYPVESEFSLPPACRDLAEGAYAVQYTPLVMPRHNEL